jgi:uncharacterized repeat protein (TIGR01451 family)
VSMGVLKGLVYTRSVHRARRLLHSVAILALLSCYVISKPIPVYALPAGLQEYLVFGHEKQIFDIFEAREGDLSVAGQKRMASVVTFTATANGQVVYYDHWEDGYEANILSPVGATTEVYGDGSPVTDTLQAGDVISLNSDQDEDTIHGYVPVDPRLATDLRYDAGDRIVSIGGPVDLIHALWPEDGTWIGGAFEMYSRQAWVVGHAFLIPVGIDTGLPDFEYVYLELEAFEDDTTVHIDNGLTSINVNLDKGETYSSQGHVDSTPYTTTLQVDIRQGTTVESNKQVQAGLITAGPDRSGGGETRFLSLVPEDVWSTEYITPVPRTTADQEIEIYVFNPNDYAITVQAHDMSGSGTFTVAAASAAAYSAEMGRYVPEGSALRLSSGDRFWAVGTVDTDNFNYDWGYALIPSRFLGQEYYTSWSPGSGNTPPGENGSPVWVAPLTDNTTFHVDYSPVDGVEDETFVMDALETRRIFDPDNDNTGMHIWASGQFAAIWGEDPDTAESGTPYLDLGYNVLPLYEGWVAPLLTLHKTATPGILPANGGTVTFRLEASSGDATVSGVGITDTLPISWTYVSGTTVITYPSGITSTAEPSIVGQDLFWDLSTTLGPYQTLLVEFDASVSISGIGQTRFDSFESDSYSGGTNWGTGNDWAEIDDQPSPTPWITGTIAITSPLFASDPIPYSGSTHLQLASFADPGGQDASICRQTDLTSFARPVLRFKRLLDDGVQSYEAFYLDVFDGVITHTGLISWTNGYVEGVYVEEEIDLISYASANTGICFRAKNVDLYSAAGTLYLDDIEIYDALSVSKNTALVSGDWQGITLYATDDEPVPVGGLVLSKSVDRSQAQVGDTVVYSLTYENSSDVTATNVNIQDTVPGSTSLSDISAGGAYVSATNTVSWTFATVGVSQSQVVTFAVTIDAETTDGTVLVNTGQAQSYQAVPVASNAVETTVQAPRLSVLKSAPANAASGQIITYTLAYSNAGQVDATGVVILDVVPISTTYVVDSLAIYTGTGWVSLTDANDGDQGTYITPTLIFTPGVTPGTVAGGESGVVRFSVQITNGLSAGDVILNQATLTQANASPQTSNLVATNIRSADLAVTKTASNATPYVGDPVAYAIAVANNGPDYIASVALSDPLPIGVTYQSHIASEGLYVPVTGLWSGISLNNGEAATLTITATVSAAGITTNTVVVQDSELFDPDASDNTATATISATLRTPTFTLTKQVDATNWWDADWSRRVKLTFDNSEQSETLVDFPVLVVLDSSRIDYSQTQNAGQDVRFVDADGTTILAHEIEAWNEGGTSYVWVKVPAIAAASSTDYMWLYYGNADVSDGQVATDVWDTHYQGVWHLGESGNGTAGEYVDSTSNDRDGQGGAGTATRVPTQTAGAVGYGQGFDGADDYIDTYYTGDLITWTVEAWVRGTAPLDNSGDEGIVHKHGNYMLSWSHLLYARRGAASLQLPPNSWRSAKFVQESDLDQWIYLVGTYTYNDGILRAYKNGSQTNENDGPDDVAPVTNAYSVKMGTDAPLSSGAEYSFGGGIDEVRISAVARSPDWIAAQYKSMMDNLIAFGPPVGAPLTYTITISNSGSGVGTNVVVTDVLPAGATYLSGGTYISSSNTISWIVPTIPVSGSQQVSFSVSTCQDSLLNASYRVITSAQGIDSLPGASLLIPLAPSALVAQFTYAPLTVTVDYPVYFASTGSTTGGAILAWSWDFGDGGTAPGATAVHTYTAGGTYPVMLRITDTCGYTDTIAVPIEVFDLPAVSIADTAVVEGDSGTVNAVFTVTLSTTGNPPIRVDYATADNTAAAPLDYSTASGTVTFEPGEITKTVTIVVVGDALYEIDETFFVNLSNPQKCTILDGQGQGTIINDDPAPTVSFGGAPYTVGEWDITTGITVALDAISGVTTTVSYTVSDGTATAPADFDAASGTLTFTPGITARTFTVTVVDDNVDDDDETVNLTLGNGIGAIVTTTNPVTLTIIDDDYVILSIDKSSTPNISAAGLPITYAIIASNSGNANADGATISDTLPDHTSFVTGSIAIDPPGAGTPGSGPPALASDVTIAAGQSVTITFAAVVNTPLPDGTVITNTASVSSTTWPTPTTDVVTTTIFSPALTLTKQTDTYWTRRVKLTFTNTAQAEDLNDFPVLVVLNSSRIDYGLTQDAGQDIRFIDADGTTVLAHEIELWDESGDSYVWVRVPQIDGGSNSDHIWMHYGNPSAPDGQAPEQVWTSSYRMVYHLNEDPELTGGILQDSTTNGFSAANQGSTDAAGWIGNAQEFDGIDQYVDLGTDLSAIRNVSAATLSAWVRSDTIDGRNDIIALSIGGSPTDSSRASLYRSNAEVGTVARTRDDNSDPNDISTSNGPIALDTWHHVVAVIDYAGDTVTIFVDGVPQTFAASFGGTATDNTNSASGAIGSEDDASAFFFEGRIDEVRVAANIRSTDWITAQYQSMTDNLVAFGSPESTDRVSGSPVVGAPLTYTLTITNIGPTTATNVVVTDTLPWDAYYVSGGTYISASDIVSWMVSTVSAGGDAQVTYVVSTCQTTLLNDAYRAVTSTQGVSSAFGGPLLTLLSPPTLAAALVHDPLTPTVNSAVSFTSTSTTDGGPIVEWAWGFGDGGTAGGPTATHTYTAFGSYTATLTVTDACGYTDTVAVPLLILIGPSLTLVKSASYADPLEPGDTITYTIVISNAGPGDATGAFISDTTPTHTEFVSDSISIEPPMAGTPGTPPALVNNMTITAGQSVTVTYAVTVSVPLTAGTVIANVASVTSTGTPVSSDDAVTATVRGVDLSIAKSSSPNPAVPGGSITYTIVVTNPGRSHVAGVTVSDTIPAVIMDATWTCTAIGSATCTPGGSGDVSDTAYLPVSGAITYTVSGTLPAWVTATLVNTATVAAPAGATDLTTTNNVATDTNTPVPQTDLTVSKADTPDPVAAGGTLTYTIAITNYGPSDASEIVVTDILPVGATYSGASGSGWACNDGGGVVTCTTSSLPVGAASGIAITVTAPVTGGLIVNSATVDATTFDPVATNNVTTTDTLVTATADLELTKAGTPATVVPGQQVTYTLTYTNNGPGVATGSIITDIVPVTLTNISYTSSGARITPSGSISYTWQVDDLAPGEGGIITVTSIVSPALITDTSFVNRAVIASSLPTATVDSDPANNADTVTTSVTMGYRPAIQIVKTGPFTAAIGETVIFTFTVVNDNIGGDGTPISGVSVDDSIAGLATYISGDDGDSFLEVDETWVFLASYCIRTDDPSPLVNVGTVIGRDGEGDIVRATDTHSTGLDYAPGLEVTKFGPDTAQIGQTVLYTFVIANISFTPTSLRPMGSGDGSPISNIAVTDTIAGPAIYVRGDANGNGRLEVGELWIFTATYTILPSDPDPLVNTVLATGRDGNGNIIADTDTHSTVMSAGLDYVFYMPLVLRNH